VIAIAAAFVALATVGAHAAATSPVVPRGDLLAADRSGRLFVLDRDGKILRRLHGSFGGTGLQSIELAADRRHAFASVLRSDRPARLYRIDLATGARRVVANAISPALSPNRKQLAYVSTRVRSYNVELAALVVRDLRTGRTRSISLGPGVPLGTPPELVINWSPDGRRLAVFDGRRVRLVVVATARDVGSQPTIPGVPSVSSPRRWLAPVFIDARTLVVLVDCCIGRQHLVAVDLRSGAQRPFARLSSPIQTVRRLTPGRLLAVTELNELALVRRGATRVVAGGMTAAAG
jgi:WD40 repeat protein